MANIADCVVLIAPNWRKLGDVIKRASATRVDSDGETECQVQEQKIVVDYAAMEKVCKAHGYDDGKPCIYNTNSLRLIYNRNIDCLLLEWSFSAKWGFPREVQHWLDSIGIDYQIGVVENGCEVEEITGEDFGLELLYGFQCDECGFSHDYTSKEERDKATRRGKTQRTCPHCGRTDNDRDMTVDTLLEYNFTPIETTEH